MAYAQWAQVGTGQCAGSGGGNNVTTPDINSTGADLIVVEESSFELFAPTVPVDNKGNAMTQGTSYATASGGQSTFFYEIHPATVGSGHHFTITNGTMTFPGLCVYAFSGIGPTLPLMISSGNHNDSTSSISSAASFTVNHSDALIISGVMWNDAGTLGAPSGYTSVHASPGPGTSFGVGLAYKIDGAIVTPSTVENPTWTDTMTGAMSTNMMVFRAADSVNRAGQEPPLCSTTVSMSGLISTISAASQGDSICVTSGSLTSTTGVGQIDGLEIRCLGTLPTPYGSSGDCTINMGTTGSGIAFGNNESLLYPTYLINFSFSANQNSAINGSSFALVEWGNANGTGWPWVVHHNTFTVTNRCDGPSLVGDAAIGGGVFRNKFITNPDNGFCVNPINTDMIAVHHIINDSNWALWQSADTFGSTDTTGLNNLYVEFNYFEGFNVATDNNTSSRTIFRFNDLHSSGTSDHGYDSSTTGDRLWEFYGNHFYCDMPVTGGAIQLGTIMGLRGGVGRIFNNVIDPMTGAPCTAEMIGVNPIRLGIFKLEQCDTITGWKGSYNDTYPASHQIGWGWLAGMHTIVGSTSKQWDPGINATTMQDGFQQDLDPIYEFANQNNWGGNIINVDSGYIGECRAMAFPAPPSKASATTIEMVGSNGYTIPPYISAGEHAVVLMADLGVTSPTIADTGCGTPQTWTPINAGTNGSLHLRGWQAQYSVSCQDDITISWTGSSTAARSAILIVMRGLEASAMDRNETVSTLSPGSTPATYTAPSPASAAQANELVLSYFALNTTTGYVPPPGANDFENDNISVTNGLLAESCFVACVNGQGLQATTGGAANTNVVLAITYAATATPTSAAMALTDSTSNPIGLAGTISFKVVGNGTIGGNSPLDLLNTDFFKAGTEYYWSNNVTANTTGCNGGGTCQFKGTVIGTTGFGARADRPTSCQTGMMYWSVDQGSWNPGNLGPATVVNGTSYYNGVGDLCTGTNTWSNANFVPLVTPHPLDNVAGGGAGCITPTKLVWTTQPGSVLQGATFSTIAITEEDNSGNACTSATDTITIANTFGTCTNMSVGGTTSGAATAGVLSVSNNTETGNIGACTLTATATGLTSAISSNFVVTDNLVFTTQPSNTVSGVVISPNVAVTFQKSGGSTDTGQSSGTGTLTINGCGASSSNNTATPTAGVMTFASLTPTTAATACNYTATFTNASNAISSNFNVTALTPDLASISPSAGTQGTTVPVTLTGTNLSCSSVTLSVSGSGVTVTSPTCVNSTTITANLVIAGNATVSTRTISATLDGSTMTDDTVNFTVNASIIISTGTGGRVRRIRGAR